MFKLVQSVHLFDLNLLGSLLRRPTHKFFSVMKIVVRFTMPFHRFSISFAIKIFRSCLLKLIFGLKRSLVCLVLGIAKRFKVVNLQHPTSPQLYSTTDHEMPTIKELLAWKDKNVTTPLRLVSQKWCVVTVFYVEIYFPLGHLFATPSLE